MYVMYRYVMYVMYAMYVAYVMSVMHVIRVMCVYMYCICAVVSKVWFTTLFGYVPGICVALFCCVVSVEG